MKKPPKTSMETTGHNVSLTLVLHEVNERINPDKKTAYFFRAPTMETLFLTTTGFLKPKIVDVSSQMPITER